MRKRSQPRDFEPRVHVRASRDESGVSRVQERRCSRRSRQEKSSVATDPTTPNREFLARRMFVRVPDTSTRDPRPRYVSRVDVADCASRASRLRRGVRTTHVGHAASAASCAASADVVSVPVRGRRSLGRSGCGLRPSARARWSRDKRGLECLRYPAPINSAAQARALDLRSRAWRETGASERRARPRPRDRGGANVSETS
jgi:hypothetical protein